MVLRIRVRAQPVVQAARVALDSLVARVAEARLPALKPKVVRVAVDQAARTVLVQQAALSPSSVHQAVVVQVVVLRVRMTPVLLRVVVAATTLALAMARQPQVVLVVQALMEAAVVAVQVQPVRVVSQVVMVVQLLTKLPEAVVGAEAAALRATPTTPVQAEQVASPVVAVAQQVTQTRLRVSRLEQVQ